MNVGEGVQARSSPRSGRRRRRPRPDGCPARRACVERVGQQRGRGQVGVPGQPDDDLVRGGDESDVERRHCASGRLGATGHPVLERPRDGTATGALLSTTERNRLTPFSSCSCASAVTRRRPTGRGTRHDDRRGRRRLPSDQGRRARSWSASRSIPREEQIEDEDRIPDELRAQAAEMGLFGYALPEEYGGLGVTMSEDVQLAFEFGYTTPAFRSLFGTNNGIAGPGHRQVRHRRAEADVPAAAGRR